MARQWYERDPFRVDAGAHLLEVLVQRGGDAEASGLRATLEERFRETPQQWPPRASQPAAPAGAGMPPDERTLLARQLSSSASRVTACASRTRTSVTGHRW